VEDRHVSPVARVKLLAVRDDERVRRNRIRIRSETHDVWKPLLLVHDEVVNEVEIFGRGLLEQVPRRISVRAAVIHVHVEVAAPPFAGAGWKTPQGDDALGRPARGAWIVFDGRDLVRRTVT